MKQTQIILLKTNLVNNHNLQPTDIVITLFSNLKKHRQKQENEKE